MSLTQKDGAAASEAPAAPAPAPEADSGPYAKRWLMLPVILAAMFMAQFDLYVVNVAAPSLEHGLHAGQAALELIVAGYAFTYASGLVTGGRLGDLFGSRAVFLTGTIAFTVASLLCGIAQTPGQLVAARLVQGLTGAAMVPQ
ncbi:MFS transporter, partial [Streptomyces spiralis]